MHRLILRRVIHSDGPALVEANSASREHRHPWVLPFTEEAGFEAWYWRTITGPNIGLIAHEATSGQLVGVVNLNEIVGGAFKSAYLGYYGYPGMPGAGLMTQAVGLAVERAFKVVGLHRLEANIQPTNTRSAALVRRLGFRSEGLSPRYLKIGGEWQDHERWALLADAPAPA